MEVCNSHLGQALLTLTCRSWLRSLFIPFKFISYVSKLLELFCTIWGLYLSTADNRLNLFLLLIFWRNKGAPCWAQLPLSLGFVKPHFYHTLLLTLLACTPSTCSVHCSWWHCLAHPGMGKHVTCFCDRARVNKPITRGVTPLYHQIT